MSSRPTFGRITAAASIFAVLVIAIATSVSMQATAAVGINKAVSFQGKVVNTNGTNVADATYTFRFRVYTGASGDATNSCSANTCMWEETKSLATVNGIFQTNLGDTVALPGSVDFNSDNLYLAVVFNGDTEMTPRIRLTAVPYAFNADKLDGLDSSSFVQLSPGSPQTGFINVSGNITSGGTLQANALDTAAANAISVGATNATAINIGKTAGSGAVNLNGTVTAKPGAGFDSATAFQIQNSGGYSLLTVDTAGGRVGISTGSNSLTYSLEVNGTAGIIGNLQFANGSTRVVDVAAATSGAGYNLSLRGGAAGTGNANGGNVVLTGGTGSGTGARGLVMLDTPAFTTITNTTCSANCTITQANIDNNSAVIVTASATSLTITMPDPTNLVAGRVVYVTGGNGSNDFALNVNSGPTLVTIAMRQNSTATMIWNGSDWTAAGASSSTTLQSAYDNTLASAGGAEILLNNTSTSNGLTIRNSTSNPILGSVFEVQSSIGTNFLSVNSNATEYAANGGGETTPFNTTNDWSSIGAGTVNRYTSNASYIATGQASVEVNTPATANTGVRNKLTGNLAVNTTYQVSVTGKLPSGTFSTLEIQYSRDGSALTPCTSYSTQTLTTTGWSKITCVFTTDATAATGSSMVIRQTDATARSFYIDNLSVTLSTITSSPPNVQIGGGSYGGAVTLFTLDKSSSPPVAAGNDVYYGSMYYDTTSGRIQCYQANGWGACGSAPDTFVNLAPEYAGAVLNGIGIGTMTADFCSNQSGVLAINAALCSAGQAVNYYKWTSPQATQQSYSIYLTYQLPGGFKKFQSDTTVQLTGRTDNTTNGVLTYEMFRSEGGIVTACGTETTVTTSANVWQTVGINGNEATGCSFTSASANSFVIFKINVKAKSNANVYAGTLSFTITNQ